MSATLISPKVKEHLALHQAQKAVKTLLDSEAEKQALLAQFDMEELDRTELLAGRILVAKFIRTNIGKIITSTQTQNEDKFQAKVGLVLKLGPLAFENDDNHDWKGQRAKVGDWILFFYGDGHDFDYSGPTSHDRVPCKVITEGDVQMILTRPDFAY